jgi:hypothetical protein
VSAAPFLSFTIENEGKMIQVHANRDGVDRFIAALQKLKETGHLHLWGPEVGGFLSEKDPWGEEAITDVSMTTDESHLRKPAE